MDKENFQSRVMEYLSGSLEEKEQMKFKDFLETHPEEQQHFNEVQAMWKRLNNLPNPKPSPKMDAGFYEMLHHQMEEKEKPSNTFVNLIETFLSRWWTPQLSYGILILAMGLGLGYFFSPGRSDPGKMDGVSGTETEEVRERLVLTLLEQPSANKRLQGVSEANKIERVDETVIKALLQTLNNDPNVNVRLAAIESLTNYVSEPMVRMGLVQSIVQQNSPIVQVTLANLMVALQEKESIASFKHLIQTQQLDSSVKKKLENSIEEII